MLLPNVGKKLQGFNLLAHKAYSENPADSYLSIVLVKRHEGDGHITANKADSPAVSIPEH